MSRITRNWNGMPSIISNKIEEGTFFENSLVGFGTLIIDKEFLTDMDSIANQYKDDKELLSLLTKITNEIIQYFSSSKGNQQSREQTYQNYEVVNEEGMIIGTYMSSLKGKNISKCSEKSLAAYIILEKLYTIGSLSRKPSLILSQMSTSTTDEVPHAFVLLDKDNCDDYTKHLLYDVENLTTIEDSSLKQYHFVGLYSLTDSQYDELMNGKSCTPSSIYEKIYSCKEVGEKRIYGKKDLSKTL